MNITEISIKRPSLIIVLFSVFTLLGFIGLYLLLGMLFLLLVGKIINKGPHHVELSTEKI